jgi:hypothetical protein
MMAMMAKSEIRRLIEMLGGKTWAPAVLLIVLLIAAGTIYAAWVSQEHNRLNKDKSVAALENLRLMYSSVNSVHIVADAKITVYGGNFAIGRGSFEYWAEGARYRIKCSTDKQLKLNSDVDIAYNGERFQFFDVAAGTLSYRSTDDFRSHAALPNPFFLPVDFLSRSDDDCRLCRLRLSDMKSDNERWSRRAQALEKKAERHDSNNNVVTELEMPGGTTQRTPFNLRITMSGPDEETAWPSQIERIDSNRRVRASVSFKDFMENGPLRLPRDITVTVFDEKGNLTFRLEYAVKLLEINRRLQNDVFTISFDDAESVWDSDGRRFVQEKRAKASRQ